MGHVFDLTQLAPVGANGWVLLGDTSRYVSVSSKRFSMVAFVSGGIQALVTGPPGERVALTALKPCTSAQADWTVVVKHVQFPSGKTPAPVTVKVNFGSDDVEYI